MSTLFYAVCICITDHDLPLILIWFQRSHPYKFCVQSSFPSLPHSNSIETSLLSLMIHDSLLTEENSIQSSLDTSISMFHPPVSAQSVFALQKKIHQNTSTKIEAFEVIGFRCILTGPRGCTGKHVWMDARSGFTCSGSLWTREIAGRRRSREGGGRKSAAAATEAGPCCCWRRRSAAGGGSCCWKRRMRAV